MGPVGQISLLSSLETFLGGMETPVGVFVDVGYQALKPSLVEWKPEADAGKIRSLGTLKPSLVEWKLFRPSFTIGGCCDLETFLGGMETLSVGNDLLHVVDLETFLGGMETLVHRFIALGHVPP